MATRTEPRHEVAVELVGVSKTYPGVVANDSIDLVVRSGEVHMLLGENGAGKSTLIGILSGMVAPDAGSVIIDGSPVAIKSPRDALDLGVGTVYQHSQLVATLTVLDNMLLGTSGLWTLDRSTARRRLEEFSELLDVEIDPDTILGDMSLGERQRVEIVRALWRGQRVLVLDEPTSMLTPQGVEALGRLLRRLADQGLAVILITHKLNEALDLGDRVTVLRRGKKAGEIEPETLANRSRAALKTQIVDLMFGTSETGSQALVERQRNDEAGSDCFTLEDVSLAGPGHRPIVDHISLGVAPGEILGIAGIDGNGQKELAEIIAGQRLPDSGRILLDGRPVERLTISARQDLGIRYVTDDRHGEGTVGPLSVALNTVLKRIGQRPFWHRTLIRHSLIREFADVLIEEHDVRAPHGQVPMSTLSGGNMQKIVVGRELAMGPRLVVYNKPTYGLDVRTIKAILGNIVDQSEEGTAAILISTELEELIAVCDRIAVMYQGQVTGILDSRPGIEPELGRLMTGASEA